MCLLRDFDGHEHKPPGLLRDLLLLLLLLLREVANAQAPIQERLRAVAQTVEKSLRLTTSLRAMQPG
jgi:hypothetical protein